MFYDRFVELCKARGISPAAVTREIGLNNSSPTAWKRGAIPNSKTLQKLADYFGVSVDYLLAENLGIKAGGKIKAGGGIETGGPVEVGPGVFDDGEPIDPTTKELYEMIGKMSREQLLLLLAMAEQIEDKWPETAPQSTPAPPEGE